ncbi:DNA/RNA non-specific endonuclease [Candidatus Protofrankia californiensis]|uniref:DNA/RNA non-specific endonuclease n=1 Tax=Candidatus Protofrankia californiensis TaxID=1839754 RepID=UPI00104176E9|nr:DNA/RNA non-specific endonuclease [Candidatus Protofrankia californiensis]
MDPVGTVTPEQREAVATRVARRTGQRRGTIDTLRQPGGIARADEPARVASRIDRLSRYHPDVRPVNPAAIATGEPAAVAAAGAILERIIQVNDLLGVGYLEGGVAAARAVGRINIRDSRGRLIGYGTGSLVSPDLLLTNQHVLPDADTAASSSVEFDYQDGVDGRPLPLQGFALAPQRFFLADTNLDCALIAVQATPAQLATFGYNRLVEAEGKAIIGDFVTIIQHPQGEKKQVALRENRIVDLLDRFLHYETDTEPGSSGSPVFNDQWEIVALHHAGVPAPADGELGGTINEGIRVSRLAAFLRAQHLPPAQQTLLDRLFTNQTTQAGLPAPRPAEPVAPPPAGSARQSVALTVPFDIRLRADLISPGQPVAAGEAIRIDPDYASRRGYDPDFLGDGHRAPLPTLHADLVPLAAVNRLAANGDPAYVLPYHHFSVVLNRQRRLAFFTAVNIDGNASFRLRRESDRWSFDPRVPADEQTGEGVYRDNPLDRGHLVRRLDPAWGASRVAAKLANDDTFHFTNCTPQHADFNQNQTTWAGLEDYVLESADNRDLKVSVFTGPVLSPDDEPYRGVQLPRQFWKVAVMVKDGGGLSATAYLLSQESLLDGLEVAPEAFAYGAYKTYQVPVRRIEELTRLSFGSVAEADPLGRVEAVSGGREIGHPRQIIL